jgi:hypothetical protein
MPHFKNVRWIKKAIEKFEDYDYIHNESIYADMVRHQSTFKKHQRPFFKMILLSRYLSKDLKIIFNKVLQTHTENLLLAMLTDESGDIRENQRSTQFLRIREKTPSAEVRQFVIPQIDIQAETYTELIDLNSFDLIEPPLTKNITNEDLHLQQFENIGT